MIQSRYLTIFTLFFCLVGYSMAHANGEKKYTLTGLVYDQSDAKPLEYATITVTGANGALVDGAITDGEGKFELTLPGGNYQPRRHGLLCYPRIFSNRNLHLLLDHHRL